VGGVVSQAKPLMEIVPDDTLEVETKVSNKDIGFVQPGQTAAVRLETFSFTRYGYLHGAVRQISNDAETTKKQTLALRCASTSTPTACGWTATGSICLRGWR
jgi:hemolysin D